MEIQNKLVALANSDIQYKICYLPFELLRVQNNLLIALMYYEETELRDSKQQQMNNVPLPVTEPEF